MTDRDPLEPPRHVWYELDEAQDLLADMEDARDALIEANQLSATMRIEEQIRRLSRKLGFDQWEGGADEH